MRKFAYLIVLPIALMAPYAHAEEITLKCDSSSWYGTEAVTIKIDTTAKTVSQQEGTGEFTAGKDVSINGDNAEWKLPMKVPIVGNVEYTNKLDLKALTGKWKEKSGYDEGDYKNCKRG